MKKKAKTTLNFLLDESMPKRTLLHANKWSNVNIRHITHDYGLAGLSDREVLNRAIREKRILVCIDWDFKNSRALQSNLAIVKFVGGLLPKDLSSLFSKLIKNYKKSEDYFGKIISVSRKGYKVIKVAG